MALETLANIKMGLGVTGTADDGLLGQLQAAADAYIAEYCGRSFEGGSFEEFFPGGGRLLVLQNFPVATVASVAVDGSRQFGTNTILDPSAYVVDSQRGLITNLCGSWLGCGVPAEAYPGAVRVQYSVASAAVPAAVIRAAIELIGNWYRQVKTHVALGQLDQLSDFENGILTEFPRGLSEGFPLPPAVSQLLQPYRRVPL